MASVRGLFSTPRTRLVSQDGKKRKTTSEGEGQEARKRCNVPHSLQPGRSHCQRDPRLEIAAPNKTITLLGP